MFHSEFIDLANGIRSQALVAINKAETDGTHDELSDCVIALEQAMRVLEKYTKRMHGGK
jgi:hypothetical protein